MSSYRFCVRSDQSNIRYQMFQSIHLPHQKYELGCVSFSVKKNFNNVTLGNNKIYYRDGMDRALRCLTLEQGQYLEVDKLIGKINTEFSKWLKIAYDVISESCVLFSNKLIEFNKDDSVLQLIGFPKDHNQHYTYTCSINDSIRNKLNFNSFSNHTTASTHSTPQIIRDENNNNIISNESNKYQEKYGNLTSIITGTSQLTTLDDMIAGMKYIYGGTEKTNSVKLSVFPKILNIHSNLITNSFSNHENLRIIHSFPINVPHNSIIREEPVNIIYLPLSHGIQNIFEIDLELRDENGNFINLNQEEAFITLHLRESSKKII